MKTNPQQAPTANPIIEANRTLGKIERIRKDGKPTAALKLCKALLKQFPDYVGALHTIGLIYAELGDMKSATFNLAYAAALNPSNMNIQLALASIYNEIGATKAATKVLDNLVTEHSDLVVPLIALATQLNENNEFERAVKVFNDVLEREPSNSSAWDGLAKAKSEMGLLKEAADAWLSSVKYTRPSIGTVRALSQLPKELVPIELSPLLKGIDNNSKGRTQEDEAQLSFIKLNILINSGEIKKGIEQLNTINKSLFENKKTEYETSKLFREKYREALDKLTELKSVPNKPSNLPTSIHIFGPSRSGKSTLESILGILPDVHCGFESPILKNVTQTTYMEAGLPVHLYAFQLPRSTDAIYLDLYKKDITSRVGEKSFFTSTNPGRIYDIYQMARIIPNMRVVFVKRDIDDVIYRMYRTLYRKGKAYSYNLDAAREYVKWYYSMQDKYVELLQIGRAHV